MLLDAGMLVPADDPDAVETAERHRRWHQRGWSAALDHHMTTYDYPYFDYAQVEAFDLDASMMAGYARARPDDDRYKSYPGADERIAGPATSAALARLSCPVRTAWSNESSRSVPTTAEDVLTLLSAVFGQVRSRRPKGPNRVPLVRKTSPSGGARHPVEAYLFASAIDGLRPGVYHFATRDNQLERIGDLVAPDELRRMMTGAHRYRSAEPAGYLVLTGVWSRNMYRYREPRTYRTVFMDAGHVAATTELVGRGLGLPVFWHHGIDDEAIHRAIGVPVNGLSEGVIFGAAIGFTAAAA